MRQLARITFVVVLMHTNLVLATDFWWGERDIWGPYPRIPDKQLLKKEIEFADECRSYLKAPKPVLLR